MSKSIDRPLLIAILILLGIGLLMIASAGVFYGQVRFGDAYYFFKQQLLGLGVGLILLFVFQRVHYLAWRRFVVPLFFMPGFGTTVYGAARWVEIGPLSFQPSEVMKLSIILYLASWLSSRGKARVADFFEGFATLLALLSVVGFLIIKQPDTGTLGLIFLIALSIFFASGASLSHLLYLFLGALVFLGLLIKMAPYRLQRFLVYINPEHDPQGYGYQITQALQTVWSH